MNPNAFHFAAEYPVRIEALSLFYTDLSSFLLTPPQSSCCAAAAVWATMEIAANIIEHGHPQPDPNAVFHMDATINSDGIQIVLRDRGLVFDRGRLSYAVLPADWQTHQRGGLGLSLARRAVDELSYVRDDGVNVWKIVVRGA